MFEYVKCQYCWHLLNEDEFGLCCADADENFDYLPYHAECGDRRELAPSRAYDPTLNVEQLRYWWNFIYKPNLIHRIELYGDSIYIGCHHVGCRVDRRSTRTSRAQGAARTGTRPPPAIND